MNYRKENKISVNNFHLWSKKGNVYQQSEKLCILHNLLARIFLLLLVPRSWCPINKIFLICRYHVLKVVLVTTLWVQFHVINILLITVYAMLEILSLRLCPIFSLPDLGGGWHYTQGFVPFCPCQKMRGAKIIPSKFKAELFLKDCESSDLLPE